MTDLKYTPAEDLVAELRRRFQNGEINAHAVFKEGLRSEGLWHDNLTSAHTTAEQRALVANQPVEIMLNGYLPLGRVKVSRVKNPPSYSGASEFMPLFADEVGAGAAS